MDQNTGLVRLNLGCGEKILDGFINVDLYQDDPRVFKWDLNMLPLPFKDDSADEILMHHVLEHVLYPYELLIECKRILKDDGVLNVKLPTFSNGVTHRSFYHGVEYLYVLYRKGRLRDYQLGCFDLVHIRLNKFVLFRFNRVKRLMMRFFSWWCSLGFGELEVVTKKRKSKEKHQDK